MSEYDPLPPGPDGQYIAYPKAMTQLAKRLKASPEELAVWVFMGPDLGGLPAYLNANELDPPPEFCFDPYLGDDPVSLDYLSHLTPCWFRREDILNFNPTRRFITGAALIERWRSHSDMQAEAFIRAKIGESRLLDIHPISGLTQGSEPGKAWYPPLSSGLFELSKIEAIEKEDSNLAKSGTSETTANGQAGCGVAPDANTGGTIDPCAVFRALRDLAPDEVTIAFVGDRNDDGLGANNMLEISARDARKRVALAVLGLIDKRTGELNLQGGILLGFTLNNMLPRNNKNTKRMSRLRLALLDCLGLRGDPFEDYRLGGNWRPRFQIVDRRGAADDRARREAERRTGSFEQAIERGDQFAEPNASMRSFEREDDDAAEWLDKQESGSAGGT